MRTYHIIDEIKKKFPFTTAEKVPGHFRDYQIKNLISNAVGHIQKVVDSTPSTSTSASFLPIRVTSSIYIDHSNFPRPPNCNPKPDKNSKYDLSDCYFVVTRTMGSRAKMEIPLVDILDERASVYTLNKNIRFGHFIASKMNSNPIRFIIGHFPKVLEYHDTESLLSVFDLFSK